jgi:hypothetical protein
LQFFFAHKVWAPKVVGVPSVRISGLPCESPKDKMPFGCGPCGKAQSII